MYTCPVLASLSHFLVALVLPEDPGDISFIYFSCFLNFFLFSILEVILPHIQINALNQQQLTHLTGTIQCPLLHEWA